MVDYKDIVFSTALSVLRLDRLSDVVLVPTTDPEGADAWQVSIVLKSEDVSGDEVIDLILGLRRALLAVGDERFPFVDFATVEELAADVDPEE